MKNSFMYVSSVLNLEKPEHQLVVAEQEKAMRKEEFEMARKRLMVASGMVNDLKAMIYYSGKEVCNG